MMETLEWGRLWLGMGTAKFVEFLINAKAYRLGGKNNGNSTED